MMKIKMFSLSFALILITSTVFAQDLQSVSFDEYLKSFDYQERKNMKIDIHEMLDLYKKGMVQIIDIRFKEEYQVYNFSFMKNIPLNELPTRIGELDPTKIIVTVCPHYDRAEIARTYLTLKGMHSKYLVEGIVGLAEYLRGDKAKDFSKFINM